jgi:hypothetical protein
MTVISRRVAASPKRTAAQTWEAILALVAPESKSAARAELAKAAGVACASISAEAIGNAPIVLWGSGPRVRIYGVFGEDAITGDGVTEDALVTVPTTGDWRMSIPCSPDDAAWCRKKLAGVSDRISARSSDEELEDDSPKSTASSRGALTIDIGEFMKK